MSQTHVWGGNGLSLVAEDVKTKCQLTSAKHTMYFVINVLGLTHFFELNMTGIFE